MPDDIIELKQGFGPLKINIRALLRSLQNRPDGASVVATRFLDVFRQHGIVESQIQRFIPEITLDKLQATGSLLGALTDGVLKKTSKLLGIQRTWLEGIDDSIYETRTCYKNPKAFISDLASIWKTRDLFPVRVLYCGKQPDARKRREQRMALLLVEKLGEIGHVTICRYHIYSDAWDWSHNLCRFQLKAMTRLVDQVFDQRVPLYRVKSAELEQVLRGSIVPRHLLIGSLITKPSLEDYVMSPEEGVSEEAWELPDVFEYIRTHEIDLAAHQMARRLNVTSPQKVP